MSTLLGVKLKTDQLSWVWCNTPVIPMAQVVCSKPASARDTLETVSGNMAQWSNAQIQSPVPTKSNG